MRKLKVGDRVLIINKPDNPNYIGREGHVRKIEGTVLYGSWGESPLDSKVDEFTRVSEFGSF